MYDQSTSATTTATTSPRVQLNILRAPMGHDYNDPDDALYGQGPVVTRPPATPRPSNTLPNGRPHP